MVFVPLRARWAAHGRGMGGVREKFDYFFECLLIFFHCFRIMKCKQFREVIAQWLR